MAIEREDLNQELVALYNNEEFSKRALALVDKSQEEYYKIVKTYIPEISFKSFTEDTQAIEDYYRSKGLVSEDGLLELDQLDEVAGGAFIVGIVVLSIT